MRQLTVGPYPEPSFVHVNKFRGSGLTFLIPSPNMFLPGELLGFQRGDGMLAKLNAHAFAVSENGRVKVTVDAAGWYWLKLKRDDGSERTLAAVGYKGCPVAYMRGRIDEYFAGM